MTRTSLARFSSAVLLSSGALLRGEDLMAGKVDTGRTILLEATVDAPASAVFKLWTTEAGIQSFFAPRAVIDPRVGGRYEIVFAPELDPQGESAGTKGARILRFEPDRRLAFEWFTFVSRDLSAGAPPGATSPPVVPEAVRNARPIPTWVEISFEPVAGQPGRTRVRLSHRGFRTGTPWDESFEYFWRAWATVLGGLGARCAHGA
jgi:uncharacterized protein YndB with AHSA1/START domain